MILSIFLSLFASAASAQGYNLPACSVPLVCPTFSVPSVTLPDGTKITTAGLKWLGILTSTPTAHGIGDMYYAASVPALAVSTAAFSNSVSGWIFMPLQTGSASWTSY